MHHGAVGETRLKAASPAAGAVVGDQFDVGRRLADQQQQRGVVGARQPEDAAAAQEPRRRQCAARRDAADAALLGGDDAGLGELAVGPQRRRLAGAALAREPRSRVTAALLAQSPPPAPPKIPAR